ncbi:hypothetical protein FACS1894141_0410 [Spirochaetia bacterium]|nr:hypothetical protein FACS1894141_0410 [Spirochaetia bacterium]
MNNSSIQDTGLSWAAKGLLAYLLSLPETWTIHLSELYARDNKGGRSSDGRVKTQSAMEELIKAGYIKKIQGENKRRDTKYVVYEDQALCRKPAQ